MNAIDQRFDQPSFDTYAKIESLLIKTLNWQDKSEELKFMEKLYNDDVNISMLTAQMEILQVLLKDGDYSCFDDIIVKIKELPNPEREMINNGNWTEWSAIWSEIIRVISKSNERAARVWFEITSMISDQNCMTRSSITTLLQPFRNHSFFVNINICLSMKFDRLVLFHFHFDRLQKGCDLE